MILAHPSSQQEWDAFVSGLTYAQFTQSWSWGELQRSEGHDIARYFVASDESSEPIAAAQFIHQPRALVGGYWLAPRGPVFVDRETSSEYRVASEILDFLVGQLKLPRSLFLRLEPLLPSRFSLLATRLIPHRSYNPAATILIDLTKPEDDLLAVMHPKTRYNIRLAERHGVTVRVGTAEDIGAFLRLTKETEGRDRFHAPNFDYLEKTYRMMAEAGIARLRIAELRGDPLAMSMEMAYGDTVTYLHGASSSRDRNVMAPFTLHWEAMRAAKNEGFKTYDFWGCNPENETDPNYKKSWEGITRFKLGWGGRRVGFVGTLDVPGKPWVYKILKSVGKV